MIKWTAVLEVQLKFRGRRENHCPEQLGQILLMLFMITEAFIS